MAVLREPLLPAQVSVRGEAPQGFPTEPNTAADVGGRLALWLGPDEWLVVGATEADYPIAVDVSANRVAFELAGGDAIDVLAQGCSLDLERMEPGTCAQTLLARAPILLLHVDAQTWAILVRPSYANYIRAWLKDVLSLTSPRSTR